jgi:excisionase family DNA binding protein
MDTVTVLEASRRSGVPAGEIYRSIDQGDLAGFRDGSEIKVRVQDLEQLGRRSPS